MSIDTKSGENLVFVTGLPRSGTTWLLSILELHPQCFGIRPEHVGINVQSYTKETGLFLRGFSDEEIRNKIDKLPKDKLLIEKTPSHIFELHKIKSVFPKSKILFIERNHYDILYSMVQKNDFWKDSPKSLTEAISLYNKYSIHINNFDEFSYLIKYEDLWESPYSEIKNLFHFLELSTDGISEILEKTILGKNLNEKLKGVFRKGEPGQGLNNFSNNDIKLIDKKIKPTYPTKNLSTGKNKNVSETHMGKISQNSIAYNGKHFMYSTKSQKPLNILLSTHHLNGYTGSEIFLKTLAVSLKKYGHKVIVYSKYIGSIKDEFRQNSVDLTDSLENLKNKNFDLAHVSHNINAIEIRNYFPNLPIIYLSQGVLPFLEQPPIIDIGISKYLAISEEIRNNLISHNIDPSKIEIIGNIVDETLFFPQKKLNKKPQKALILSSRITTKKAEVIKQACSKLGIEYQFKGGQNKKVTQKELSNLLNNFDIVFSLGRGAIESILSGRIPIIFDYLGGDGIVTPESFREIKKCNFSGRRFGKNYSTQDLIDEISKYDQSYSNILRELAIKEYSTKSVIPKLVNIYYSVVENSSPINKVNFAQTDFINNILIETRNYSSEISRYHLYSNLKSRIDINKILPSIEQLINNNQLDNAKNLLEVLLLLQKDNIDLLNDLSVVEIMQNNYQSALRNINKILQIDPHNEIAKGNLLFIEQQLNETTENFISQGNNKEENNSIKENKVLDNDNIDISIIIPVYNNVKLTLESLESIRKTADPNLTYEIIIVDDASSEDFKSALDNYSSIQQVNYIRNKVNKGFAYSCNKGAKIATGKVLVFLNNDTIAIDGWLNAGYKTLTSDENIGIVGAKLLYPDNTIQHAGIEFQERKNHYLPLWPYHIHRNLPTNSEEVCKQKEYPAVTGACLFIKKDLFETINGFDESYGMYFEDVDLCFKVSELNKKIIYEPSCTLYHLEGKSSLDQKTIDKLNINSSKKFYDKWRFRINLMLNKEIGNSVYWLSPIFNPSGYASEAIGFALGLDKYLDLTIRHQNIYLSDDFIENMPESWKAPLFRMHKIPPKEWNSEITLKNKPIVIQHHPGEALQQIKDSYYNIGRTMYETDRIPEKWIDKCRVMDEIWVPSKFNKKTFTETGVDPNRITVIPEGIDTNIFTDENIEPFELPNKAGFNFLSIFEWTNRKGWDVLLRAYFEAFTPDNDVCLYLRTFLLSNYDKDTKEVIQNKIDDLIQVYGYNKSKLPRYELLTTQLPLEDLLKLYKSVDAFVLPSRGEGWGRPYMEAMAMGLPVIATNWSGNTEFMNDENSYLIDVPRLVEIKDNEIKTYIGHKWADPSKDHLIDLLKEVFSNPEKAKEKGKTAQEFIRKNFNLDAVAKIVVKRLKVISEKYAKPKKKYHFSKINWEGDQFSYHSLALVNREICSRLYDERLNLSLETTKNDQNESELINTYSQLHHLVKRKFNSADIHISHQWPPNLIPPKSGRWVLIQPWEFGSTPISWVKSFNENVDEVWVPSNFVKEVYTKSGVNKDKVFVIPNGISKDKFNPSVEPYKLKTKKKFKFLFVGGTIYRKGIDILLDAYFSTFTKNDDVCLVIKDFGTNTFYKGQTIQDKLNNYSSKENAPEVEYIDEKLSENEIAGLYTACNVLVHPYRGEGFGLPVLESMACGLPVIVTKGGSTDDFCNEENSLQIAAERTYFPNNKIDNLITVDHPWLLEPNLDDLKSKLKYLFENTDKIKTLGTKAHQYVHENFTWEKTVEKIEERINQLLTKPISRFINGKSLNKENNRLYYLFSELKSRYQEEDYLGALVEAENLFAEADSELIKKNFPIKEIFEISGLSALHLKKYSIAEKSLKTLLAVDPKNSKACFGLGELYNALNKFKEAKAMYNKAIKYGYSSAVIKEKINDISKRQQEMNSSFKVVKFNSTIEDAEELINKANYKGAKEILNKLLSKDANNIDALNDLAVVNIIENNFEEALKSIDKVINLNPNNEIALENLKYIEQTISSVQ